MLSMLPRRWYLLEQEDLHTSITNGINTLNIIGFDVSPRQIASMCRSYEKRNISGVLVCDDILIYPTSIGDFSTTDEDIYEHSITFSYEGSSAL